MNNVNRILLMLIAMAAIMLIAVGIDKSYDYYQDVKWEKERIVAYEQAKAEVEAMQITIEALSEDPEALIAYIEENELNYVEVEVFEEAQNSILDDSGSDSMSFADETSISDNESHEIESVSDNDLREAISGSVSENSVSGNSTSDNSVSGNSVSGNSVSDNSVSGNSVSDNSVSGNSQTVVSGNGKTEKKLCQHPRQVRDRSVHYKKTIAKLYRQKRRKKRKSGSCERRKTKRDAVAQTAKGQKKIIKLHADDHHGVAPHAKHGQKKIHEQNGKERIRDVDPHRGHLLADALEHLIRCVVKIHDRHHGCKHGNVTSGLGAMIKKVPELLGKKR